LLDNKKIHKDEVKKKPKRNISDFFRGSVPKKPCQEPQGRSSTEPKFGNSDEQSFVKSKSSTATPSKSQPLNGHPSKSRPEATLPKEENTERTTEFRKKKGKESSKATGKRCIPDLNMILLMMYCIAWFAEIIQNWRTLQAPFTEVLVALASTDLKL